MTRPISGMGYQRSGKLTRIMINGVRLSMASWEVDPEGVDLNSNNFESHGFDQGTIGFIKARWQFSGDWDAGLNSFEDPPGLYMRDDLANLLFYNNTQDKVLWSFPIARVLRARNSAVTNRGKVHFEASGVSNGPFLYPAGSVGKWITSK